MEGSHFPPGITLANLREWAIALEAIHPTLPSQPLAALAQQVSRDELNVRPVFSSDSAKHVRTIYGRSATLSSIIESLTCNETNRLEDEKSAYCFHDFLELFPEVSDCVVPASGVAFLVLSSWNDRDPFTDAEVVQAIIKIDVASTFDIVGSTLRVCLPHARFAKIKEMFSAQGAARVGSELVPQLLQNTIVAENAIAEADEGLKQLARGAVICRLCEWFVGAVFSGLDGRSAPGQATPVPYSLLKRQVNPLSLIVKGLHHKKRDVLDVGNTSAEALHLLRWTLQQNALRWPGQYVDVRSLLLTELGSHLEPCEEQMEVLLEAIDIDATMLGNLQADFERLDLDLAMLRSNQTTEETQLRAAELAKEREKKLQERNNLRQARARNIRMVLIESLMKMPNVMEGIRRYQNRAVEMYEELLRFDEETHSPSTSRDFVTDLIHASCFYQIAYKNDQNLELISKARTCLKHSLILRSERVQTHPFEFHWEIISIAQLSRMLAEEDQEDWRQVKDDYNQIVQRVLPSAAQHRRELNVNPASIFRDYAAVLARTADYASASRAMGEAVKLSATSRRKYVDLEVAKNLRTLSQIYFAAHCELDMHCSAMERFEREAQDGVEAAIGRAKFLPQQERTTGGEELKKADSHPLHLLTMLTPASRRHRSHQDISTTETEPATQGYIEKDDEGEETKCMSDDSEESEDDIDERSSQYGNSDYLSDAFEGSRGTAVASGMKSLPPAINLHMFEWPSDLPFEEISRAFHSQVETCEEWLDHLQKQKRILERLRDHNVNQSAAQLRASMQIYKKLAEVEMLLPIIDQFTREYEKGVESGLLMRDAERDPQSIQKALNLTDTSYHIASLHKQVGNIDKYLEMYSAALQGRLQILPADDLALDDLEKLATDYSKHNRFDEAIFLFSKAAACFEERNQDELVGKSLCNQAMATELKGDLLRAAALYEQSLTRFNSSTAIPNRIFVLKKLFSCYSSVSDWEKSIARGVEAVELMGKSDVAANCEFRVQLCRAMVKAKRLDEAFKECQVLLDTVPADSPHYLPMLEVQIITSIARNEFSLAEEQCRKVIQSFMRHQGVEQEMCKFSSETFIPVLLERAKAESDRQQQKAIYEEVLGICDGIMHFLSRKLQEPISIADRQFFAAILTHKGKVQVNLKLYHEAHDSYQQAFSFLSSIYNGDLSNPALAALSSEMDIIRDVVEQGEEDEEENSFEEQDEDYDNEDDEYEDDEDYDESDLTGDHDFEDDDDQYEEVQADGEAVEEDAIKALPPSSQKRSLTERFASGLQIAETQTQEPPQKSKQ